MLRAQRLHDVFSPALLRIARLAALDRSDVAALDAAVADSRLARARREIVSEGEEVAEPRLIVSGWAARVRLLVDGRRQFVSFLLPGDLFGVCRHPRPLAVSSVVALTDVTYCAAPPEAESPALSQAYALSSAMEEAHLLGQITRLGRLNAQERIGDLILELHERLQFAGLVSQNGFELPLTQEVIADALGLTSVHVNRMLQAMRREGEIKLVSGRVTLPDPDRLARKIGRTPVRVSAAEPAMVR